MTTLVALATKDALVLGCDSLGTTTKELIDPVDLLGFFDGNDDFKLKMDQNGAPMLTDFNKVVQKAKSVPFTHMTHMTKIFSLSQLNAGIMITGISSIGDRTIKSLIEDFNKTGTRSKKMEGMGYIKSTGQRFLDFLVDYYDKEYHEYKNPPYLECILGGYDKRSPIPEVVRIKFPKKVVEDTLTIQGSPFGIVFGGQMKEIQRIVFGTDVRNIFKIKARHIELLRKYREKMNKLLQEKNPEVLLPELGVAELEEIDMYSDKWDLTGFDANWGDFSEQNAIECVNFFVNVMIKSQQFSYGMPTVGGEVHIALITKEDGFRFVSKEEYSHEGHYVPKEKDAR